MSRKKTNGPSDYDVGRGRPPREYQFKPGQSGNPGGRRKGSTSLKTIVKSVMETEIEMTENGRPGPVPIIEAIIKVLQHKALRGDIRAIEKALELYERHLGGVEEPDEELPQEDVALLAQALRNRTPPVDDGSAPPEEESDEEQDDGR